MQSPVDIESSACETVAGENWKKLSASFSPTALLGLGHTGRSWQVTFDPIASSLTGGPLTSEFKVIQMHAHWGGEQGRGSEHSLDVNSHFHFSWLLAKLLRNEFIRKVDEEWRC